MKAWSIEGDFGSRARWCLARAETALRDAQAAPRQSTAQAQPSQRALLTAEALLFADAATVFAAIAVEAFINYYGVVSLGEDVYRDIERVHPPTKKLRRLLAKLPLATNLSKDHEIFGLVARLFDLRNALAHPKTQEIPHTSAFHPPQPLTIDNAHAAVSEMTRFFELFVGVDPAAEQMIKDLQRISSLPSERT